MSEGDGLGLVMKTLHKKASHIRTHTWKDIGGVPGLILDAGFFLFVLLGACAMILVGVIALLLDYLAHPFLALLRLFPTNPSIDTTKTEDVLHPL